MSAERARPPAAVPEARESRAEAWALGTLAAILLVTVAWWLLALWPQAAATPEWLVRARVVCFGAGEDGLPDAGGWLLLVGQPLGMVSLLAVGWGGPLGRGLRRLARDPLGRTALTAASLALLTGLASATVRVAGARPAEAALFVAGELPPPTYPRLDRPAPATALLDQRGREVTMADFLGRPVLVTFAFGHCGTVCPLVVQQVKEARALLEDEMDPAVVVLTLDPWRDTPPRLRHLAEGWGLEAEAYVLGGAVDRVEAALDAWGIARSRDPLTGDVTHPPLVYLVDREGTIAYGAAGSPEFLAELARRM